MKNSKYIIIGFFFLILGCDNQETENLDYSITKDNGSWLILKKEDISNGPHHTKHAEAFGKYISGYNTYILKAIDSVQFTAMDGGGYFIGITADPPESPIGYNLSLFNKQLLKAPRTTSYCSGSSYSAFIESLNLIYRNKPQALSEDRFESLRVQELDGGRREDGVKFWGKWNDDGYGNHFALVQYSNMGKKIKPINARPGDFLNISWKKGGGHSVIFLGWYINEEYEKCVVYWSSQTRTNGLGDEVMPISKIREVMFVRLTSPEKLFTFNVEKQVDDSVEGYLIDW
jgi:hypothetical protein